MIWLAEKLEKLESESGRKERIGNQRTRLWNYPLVNIQKTMKHHRFSWVNQLFRLGHFPVRKLSAITRRVYPISIPLNHYKITSNHYKSQTVSHYPRHSECLSPPRATNKRVEQPWIPGVHRHWGYPRPPIAGKSHCLGPELFGQIHGSLNVPIEHHPTIRYMVYKCL